MSAVLPEEGAAACFARHLADRLRRGQGATVTWLNHHSAMQALRAGVPLGRFGYLGIDGFFLCRLLGTPVPRTSADQVLPALLAVADPLRVALVGTRTEVLDTVAPKIERLGHSVVVRTDGYDGLPSPQRMTDLVTAAGARLVVVGLGAPRQDEYALAVAGTDRLVLTCGGWLDQFAQGEPYYPSWAYPLRLNWLVRLAREPRRLWRRYTVEAARALRRRRELSGYILGAGEQPLRAMSAAARADARAGSPRHRPDEGL